MRSGGRATRQAPATEACRRAGGRPMPELELSRGGWLGRRLRCSDARVRTRQCRSASTAPPSRAASPPRSTRLRHAPAAIGCPWPWLYECRHGHRAPSIKRQTPGTRHRAPGIRHRASGIRHQTSGNGHLAMSSRQRAPGQRTRTRTRTRTRARTRAPGIGHRGWPPVARARDSTSKIAPHRSARHASHQRSASSTRSVTAPPQIDAPPALQSSHRFAAPFNTAPSNTSSQPLRTSPSTRAPGASVSLPRVVITAPPPLSPTVPQT